MSISFISATQLKAILKMIAGQLNTNGRISGLKFKFDGAEISLGLIEISYEGSDLDCSVEIDVKEGGLDMDDGVANVNVSGNSKSSVVVKDLRIVNTVKGDIGVFELDELEFSGLSEAAEFAMGFIFKGDL